MEEIERNIGSDRKNIEVTGLMESDPEYQLIVEANNIAVEVDGEIGKIDFIFFYLFLLLLMWQLPHLVICELPFKAPACSFT